MIRENQVEKMLDELEEEFTKANMPINDKLTLFAKVSNAIYKCTEQEPCTDAISRQAAIDELYKMLHDCFGADDEELDAVITTLNELPPVTPQPKMGHWIDTDNYYQRSKCSECGCHTRDARPNYCSNCGAKMEEVKE
jgi:hypothetical protein